MIESKISTQFCPLCGHDEALYRLIDHGNRKHVTCAHCGEYQVSVGAELRLRLTPDWLKARYSQTIRESIPDCIISFTIPNRPRRDGFGHSSLIVEELPRQSLQTKTGSDDDE